MKKDKASNTAQFVAVNRALGNLSPQVPGFSDPIAEYFLSSSWARQIERRRKILLRSPDKSPFPFWVKRGMAVSLQFRTVMLDKAIQSAFPVPQLVILGAGLDSRAWRLKGLEQAIVFEADHPDTQTVKRTRVTNVKNIHLLAKEVRFVPINFTTDDLKTSLKNAGFDETEKTFWLWEGVTMYLTREDVKHTLKKILALSAPGSVLALTYMNKKNGRIPRSLFLSLIKEPACSAFLPTEMSGLTKVVGWHTLRDSGIEEWKKDLAPAVTLTEKDAGMQWLERIWIGHC